MQSQQLRPKKRFGSLVTIYRDRPLHWRDLITTFFPASLAALTPVFYGVQRAQYARSHYGPAAAQAWAWPWYMFSTFALIPLLWLGMRRLRRSRRVVMVFKNGLSIQGMGRRNRGFTWAEISGIANTATQDRFLGIPIGKRNYATLHPSVGKAIKLDHRLPHLDELCARIKAKIYPRLVPELRSSLQSGSTIYFGPINMNLDRISIRGKTYPWDQIPHININKGMVMIEFENRRVRRIPVGGIPNIEIFIQLIQEGLVA